jgi:signal transduction histidine kinase
MVHGALTGVVLLFLVHRQLMLLSQHSLRLAVSTEKSLELERNHRERQAQFLSMLTHELRTPLSVLRLSLGSLMKTDSTAGRHALAAIEDMNNLINRCNQLDQLEQGKQVAQFTRVRLSDLIQDVLQKSPGFSHTLVQVDPELFVWSDVVLLQTILFNLVDNAYKYRKPEGVVRILVHREQRANDREERVLLSVSNPLDSRALPDPDRMFDKYYRSAAAHQTSGTGLGLYIVKGLSKLIGVQVSVAMGPGPEMVLKLVLPTELSQLDAMDPRDLTGL